MFVHRSISDIDEPDLVQLLVDDPFLSSYVLGIYGIPRDAVHRTTVNLDGIPGNFKGDVDILLCAPGRPDLAVAIQVKRIKVRNDRLNKLQEFKKGVRQANLLAKIGFSQVYLFVLVVVDSRERNAGKTSYEGADQNLRRTIEQAISTTKLDSRVGLMRYEFVQPMDHAPFNVGTRWGHLVRRAQTVRQAPELTAWVARVMDRSTK